MIREHVDVAPRLQAALTAWQADVDAEAKSRQSNDSGAGQLR